MLLPLLCNYCRILLVFTVAETEENCSEAQLIRDKQESISGENSKCQQTKKAHLAEEIFSFGNTVDLKGVVGWAHGS